MKKRKKDDEAVQNKIRNKLILRGKRSKSTTALKGPEKFIKQYRAQQKSYSHYKLKVNHHLLRISRTKELQAVNKII